MILSLVVREYVSTAAPSAPKVGGQIQAGVSSATIRNDLRGWRN